MGQSFHAEEINLKKPVFVYLASPRAAAWRCWTRLDMLAASLKLLRLHAATWPVVIFHEDYTEDDKKRLNNITGYISFEQIDFKGEEEFYINHRPDNRVGTYGYCMMCRFFCGPMQRHPALTSYDNYVRLDDDSYIMELWSSDCVERLLNSDYAYRSSSREDHKDLWNYTLEFMADEKLAAPPRSLYDSLVPYNNFHVSKLALWQNPTIKKFLDGLEAMHAYTRLGWTDACVHKMVALILGPALGLKTYCEQSFAYRHNQHCAHDGPHTKFCPDRFGGEVGWGPPACLEEI